MSDLISRKRIEFELCESNMPKKYRDFCRRVINSESLSPSVDAVKVVRCWDCKHSIDYYNDGDCYCRRPNAHNALDYIFGGWNWFCADGERKEATNDRDISH